MILVRKFFAVFFLSMSIVLGAIGMEAFVAILNSRVEENKKDQPKNISAYSGQRDQTKNKQDQPIVVQGEYGRTVEMEKIDKRAKL